MSYIKREDVVRAILAERDKIPHTVPAAPYELVASKPNQHGNSMRGGIRKALRCIEQAPAENVAPIRHARWESDETCSNCGKKSTDGLDAEKWSYWFPDFCPHCGAIMDL